MVDGEQPGQSSNKDVKRSKDSAPAFVAQNAGAPEDLPIPDSPLWAILDELATKDEAELRRILRPHDEAGLSWDMDSAVILLRERLDAALEVLTYFEINIQTGRQAPKTFFEFAGNPDPGRFPALPSLRRLFASEAFLHYCDSYLYFGVRFLAERISPAVPAVRRLMTQYQQAEQNWRPFALSTPPDVHPEANIAEAFFAGRPVSNDEQAALYFLDGFFDRPLDYELWLGGLLAEYRSDQVERFVKITTGLESWVRKRVAFYFRLAKLDDAAALGASAAPGAAAATQQTTLERMAGEFGPSFAPDRVFGESASSLGRGLKVGDYWRPPGGWTMKDPAAARFGLADLYWIARILRASVSAAGTVRYEGNSWLHLMRFSANVGLDKKKADEIFQYEEVLRSVFDYCCELVQNAIAVTAERIRLVVDPSSAHGRPEETKRWRFVFDEELETIAEQRLIRRYRDLPTSETDAGRSDPRPVAEEAPPPAEPRPPSGDSWSTRLRTGKQPGNLLGIAFSGGGIRSATFNLGVLQGLQELDLLQQIDYISSVSGGGFVASWLVANVRRSAHWLGRVTDWNASIAHLRAYSNYLAPKTGILSADTWTLAATWIRNAFFIQITGIAWLFTLLLLALLGKNVFIPLPDHPHGKLLILSAAVLSAVLMSGTTLLQLLQLSDKKREKSWTSHQVRWLTVLPAWTGAFLTSALLWQQARLSPTLNTLSRYSEILKAAFGEWNILLFISLLVFTVLALVSLQRWRVHAFWIAPFCTAVIYLGVSGVFYLDRQLDQQQTANAVWCSYIFSPILLLAAYTLGVVVFIGLTGRNSKEGIREWWTRLGAWLGVYALGAAAITAVAAFGPQVVAYAWQRLNTSVKWAGLASWAGTVVWGLISGNSSKTNGEKNKSNALQYVAVTAGALYIIGFVTLASTLLYTLLWKIFSPDGTPYDDFLGGIDSLPHRHAVLLGCFAGLLGLGALFSHFFEINIFGLNQFYRNRLARCYLGASRLAPGVRQPNRFTGFDSQDDLKLYKLKEDPHLDAVNGRYRGPFPIVNCALNLGGSVDLAVNTRHSDSFTLTPLRCGSERPLVGYAPTSQGHGQFAGGIMFGQAVAVSGAAVSPNMGYNTSPLVAFLLTMFNVRLGWWFPNPGRSRWKQAGLTEGLYYLICELLGMADERSNFLNVSDGGHFENLAVYELVRRRCKVIIACDAECDENLQFGGLGNLIRICETDFGASIDLDVKALRAEKGAYSRGHCAVGQIKYSNGSIGYLIYIKASVSGDEPVEIAQYRSSHPAFPHETTADQFFSEDQFESYRKLGQHIIQRSFNGTVPGQSLVGLAERLADVLTPAGCPPEAFLKLSEELMALWDKFRQSTALHDFLQQLMATQPSNIPSQHTVVISAEELSMGLQLIQLMENTFVDLRLDDFWEHPDNRGWATLFMQWSRSAKFRQIWSQTRRTFGIRFEHFCSSRLGLTRDRPPVRV